MLCLVTGGAASGKSEYAERLACRLGQQGERYYAATMLAYDQESRLRVERHRRMRKGKGFSTVECPVGLKLLQLPQNGTVLLECLTNLAANERFDPQGCRSRGESVVEEILEGIRHLESCCRHVVVVSGEVFSDGAVYSSETQAYLEDLGQLNRLIAQKAQIAVEVVCSIPIVEKGEDLLEMEGIL